LPLELLKTTKVAKGKEVCTKQFNISSRICILCIPIDIHPLKEDTRVIEDFKVVLTGDPQVHSVLDSKVLKISKRLELALRMNVTSRFSSSTYQTPNYGLCETHIDPGGYIRSGTGDLDYHVLMGDVIGTVMAWLSDVKAGGGTAFEYLNREMLVTPTRGSLAFWTSLVANGELEPESSHGGCPVL
jgi:hypothetical protein